MNHKQKFLYTLLGAGIMAVGIIIGQLVTPDIKAQSNAVFDEIVCRKLTVVNEGGEQMVALTGEGFGGKIKLFSNFLKAVQTKTTELKPSIILDATNKNGMIQLFGPVGEGEIEKLKWIKKLVLIGASQGGSLLILDKIGRIAVDVRAEVWGGGEFIIYDNTGKSAATIGQYQNGGYVKVHDRNGEQRARLGVDSAGNGYIETWDRHGRRN